ncbi:MAG: ParA family partition ATPase [Polyangiales bacterium]
MIIAFAGQKGGIGKSTTAINVAVAAHDRGIRVLLVDADPQGTARTWADVASEAGHVTPTVVAMGATMHKAGQLSSIAATYDLTIIDCPPRHGDIQRSALMVADLVVLPSGPSAADAWALAAALEVVKEAQILRDELAACILITRKQGRTALARSARKVLESSGLTVLASELGYRVAYQEALALGRGVTTHSPRDAAAAEVFNLLAELETYAHGQEASRRFAPQAAAAG